MESGKKKGSRVSKHKMKRYVKLDDAYLTHFPYKKSPEVNQPFTCLNFQKEYKHLFTIYLIPPH